jgi:OPA family glycerol-3-phosphate transporter-like MFS transporter
MIVNVHERSDPSARLVRWQWATVGLMVAGYAGYYLCRSNLSVCIPLIRTELIHQGYSSDVAKIRLGTVVTFGVLAYAIGKFFAGGLADFLGGRRNFLGGMAGSILFTMVFALGGSIPVFTLAAVGNRFVQSFGWAGMIKITSRWFPYTSYGTVMGFISLSFLFGDALARKLMKLLIDAGYSWREVFLACAGTLAALLVMNFLFLKESPASIAEPEPKADPANLFGERGGDPEPSSVASLLAPLFRRRIFWWACLLSLGLTLLRETFNTWIPTYFTESLAMSPGEAADKSALFPFFAADRTILLPCRCDLTGFRRQARSLDGVWIY